MVPSYVVLRQFPAMPLDVRTLRDSGLAANASAEGFRCAVLLWCAAWHQEPAASLPDNDKELARLAGFGRAVREWLKFRNDALHKWVRCTDGRLYHPVIADKALKAWEAHLEQAHRTECARLKKAAQRAETKAVYPTFEEWSEHYQRTGDARGCPPEPAPPVPRDNKESPAIVPRETRSKGREGKGRDRSIPPDTSTASVQILEVASAMARALQAKGYSECSEQHPHLVTAATRGLTPTEIGDAADKPGKSVAYIVARAIGRRTDAAEQASGQAAPAPAVPLDPAERQRLEEREAIERRIYDIRHRCSHLEEITPEERDRQIAELLAAQVAPTEEVLS